MNVNSNLIPNSKSSYRDLGLPRQANQKQEFKTVLDGQQYRSRSLINENATSGYNVNQSMGKSNIETPDKTVIEVDKDNTCETTAEGLLPGDLVYSNDNNELKEKIINFVEIAVKTLKKNTEEPSKEALSSEKATDEPEQIQQVLQLLNFIFENIDKTPVANNDKIGFNSTKLEELVGGEKLPPDKKGSLEDDISKIDVLLGKSKGNIKITPQISIVLQNLTTQVQDIKRDLNLAGDFYESNNLTEKIINFVEFASDQLKQNIEKPSNELVDNINTIGKVPQTQVPQIQQILQSLVSMIKSTTETPQQGNKLNPISLEKLGADTKGILKNNLSETVNLIRKPNSNSKVQPQIIDVLQKLNTQVQEVKGELDLLNSLSSMIEGTYEKSVPLNQENEFNSIDLEKLLGVEKLLPETKNILKNNLNEIVELLGKSKGNNENVPQILDMIQKLTSQVQEVKGDFKLLKVNSEKNIVESKTIVEIKTTSDLTNKPDNNKLEEKIINFVETANNALKQNTLEVSKEMLVSGDSTEKMSQTQMEQTQVNQIQNLLKSLGSMIQSSYEAPVTSQNKNEPKPLNLEKLVGIEQLSPETKVILKNNISEIVTLVKQLKVNNVIPTQVIDVIQKLITDVKTVNGDLRLLKSLDFKSVGVNIEDKSIKDNQLTEDKSQITKATSKIYLENQMQSSSDTRQDNKFSGNKSFEEKFLNNLIGDNKDEMKISKAVNFMNQFDALKSTETPVVITQNNIVINKSNIEVDVIKAIKFMEFNSIKDLTVKMNPKELGEITIKLTMESGIMKASISAQNKETFNLLNQNIHDITERLKNMDIKIQSLDINIYEDSTFFDKGSSNRNNNERQNDNRGTNVGLEEDIPISINNVIEENQVNEFV